MKVLAGCEESGEVRAAFQARGHEVLSCDLKPTRLAGPHYEGDVFDVIDFPWDVGLFFFPCTNSSVSGAKHFARKKMDGSYYAMNSLWLQGWRRAEHIKNVCFEHPVSVISSLFRKSDQIIQPWMFGHYETKQTCLWLRGLPPLVPTYLSKYECAEALGIERGTPLTARVHMMTPDRPGEEGRRAEERSKTYPGIARAMAEQWG